MTASPKGTHTATYRKDGHGTETDDRLSSPVFLRNAPPMIAALTRLIGDSTGPVLEIGAGTGQHAAAFSLAFPGLDWWPSDPDPVHRASIAAWTASLRAPARAPVDIDAGTDWAANGAARALGPLAAVLAMNVLHIAPPAVSDGLIRGASQTLAPGGVLLIYGPFLRDGHYSGDRDRAFDEGLRADNPDWGLRDVRDLAEKAKAVGLTLSRQIDMPANNLLLVFCRDEQGRAPTI